MNTFNKTPSLRRRARTLKYRVHSVAGLAVVLTLASCASAPTVVPPEEEPLPIEREVSEWASTGTIGFEVAEGSIRSSYGCTVRFERYDPVEPKTDVVAIIAHGFQSDLTSMRGWAELWASRGIPSVVVSFCNSTWLNGNHGRNAEDLVLIADWIGAERIVHAGFSAGGLSALLAAAADSRTYGYIGLDPVDSDDLAATVSGFRIPSLFLFGEPSSCNAENNMLDSVPSAEAIDAYRVRFSTHCLFQAPHAPFCERVCGRVEPPEVQRRVADAIRSAATSWITELCEIETNAPPYRDVVRSLMAGGSMSVLETSEIAVP